MEEKNSKKNFIFWFGIFILLILLVLGGYFLKNSFKGKENQESLEEKYKKVEGINSSYEEKLKADFYGGKTPEETLGLFIKALEKEDVDEAGKYFLIDMKNSQETWKAALLKARENKKISEIVSVLKKAEYEKNSSSDDTAWFSVKNEKGLAEYSIVLKLNKYTGVWKIQEM